MTITRIGQFTAETVDMTEFVSIGLGDLTISTTKKNTGSRSYRVDGLSSGPIMAVDNLSQLHMGFWFNHTGVVRSGLDQLGNTTADTPLLAVGDADPFLAYVLLTYKGVLSLYVDDVLVDSINARCFAKHNVWQHVGFTIKLGSPGFASVYINGEKVLTYTGVVPSVPISYCVPPGVVNPMSSHSWDLYAYTDDFYVEDTTGELDSAPPPYRFVPSFVNGAGSFSAWTPNGAGDNYTKVDDVPHDSDGTFVSSAAGGDKDTHTTDNITLPYAHDLIAAIVYAYAKKVETGNIKLLSYVPTDLYESGTKTLTTDYEVYHDRLPVQPDTTDWNETDFNNAQFGYEAIAE